MEINMQTTRRGFLALGGLSALGWSGAAMPALASISVGKQREASGALVTIFLRGGADALSVVVPHADPEYYRNRPTLALHADRGGDADRVRDLNGAFGLHPALAPLEPLYRAGQMAIVHAVGSGDQTRSHFEAMATMERGLYRDAGPATGWIARHLETAPWENASPLRAVALGYQTPDALRGAQAITMRTVGDFQLSAGAVATTAGLTGALAGLYTGSGELEQAGRETLSVLHRLSSLDPASYRPTANAYPKDDLGDGLRQVACLLKSGVGLECACLDQPGYDTHVAQGASQGALAGLLKTLASGISAFARDLGPERWRNTTVVVLSEFGRRLAENGGAGTDHGRGGVMFVLSGAGIAGGKIHGRWPGLAPAHLDGPGDLAVTTDYRDVLSEVLRDRVGNPHWDRVFPGLGHRGVGVTTLS
jgi:uncharacterized protein (DUF1501 family)